MATYEENQQRVLDLRQQVIDPEREDPTEAEMYAAVQALHQTRGVAQAKKKVVTKTIDLDTLFAVK